MRSIVWILILVLVPPFLAYFACLAVGYRTGNTTPWTRVQLGKSGYWLTLGIIYAAVLATALVEHKI
jgi:hypothetical protein